MGRELVPFKMLAKEAGSQSEGIRPHDSGDCSLSQRGKKLLWAMVLTACNSWSCLPPGSSMFSVTQSVLNFIMWNKASPSPSEGYKCYVFSVVGGISLRALPQPSPIIILSTMATSLALTVSDPC